jgi:pimeloyl-ACP methyl ester carboxylesterase
VVLLHGFPASSFMFRDLIPLLADRYPVIAPDHLGFGLSGAPPAEEFGYTFDALAGLTALPRRRQRCGLRHRRQPARPARRPQPMAATVRDLPEHDRGDRR